MCFLTAWELSEFILLREKKFQCFFKRVNDTFSVIFFKEPKVLPINLQIWIEYVDFIQRTKESGIFRTFTLTLNISELKRKHFRMSGDAFQMMIIIYGQSRRLERQMELWYAKGFVLKRCKYDALAKNMEPNQTDLKCWRFLERKSKWQIQVITFLHLLHLRFCLVQFRLNECNRVVVMTVAIFHVPKSCPKIESPHSPFPI